MRQTVVTVVLVALLGALAWGVFFRVRAPHTMPEAAPEPSASAPASAAASLSATPPASASGAAAPAPPAPRAAALGRPLRLVGMGWDLLAPAFVAAGGTQTKDQAFGDAKLDAIVSPLDGFEAVERALARGGGDEGGADVAIIPLPELIASYDKLRALDLRVFFVTGWSRGREVLSGAPPTGVLGGDVEVRVGSTHAATFLALFVLDTSGVSLERVRLSDGGKARLVASSRDPQKTSGVQENVWVTTADAARIVPFVAVASGGLLEKHRDSFIALLQGWLGGAQSLAKDPPSSARVIAALDGAPEPIALLAWLGELESATLGDNAELFRLSGRGALALDALLAHGFGLWRSAKLTTSPSPDMLPVDSRVVEGLVRKKPDLLRPATPVAKTAERDTRVLLVSRVAKADEEEASARAGLLAAAFPRATIAVSAHQKPKKDAEALLERITLRYGLDAHRLRVGSAARAGAAQFTLEVLVPK